MSFLPRADCGNWFNSPDCFMPEENTACEALGQLWWNGSCTALSTYCTAALGLPGLASNVTHCLPGVLGPVSIKSLQRRVTPSEEYFKNYMLLMEEDTSLDNLGRVNWRLVGCLGLSWLICFACLIKGVKSAGKVVWFTAIFPYVVLVLLFVRGVTLPGAMDGIVFFITPVWSKLLSVHVSRNCSTGTGTDPSSPPRSGLTQHPRYSTLSDRPLG